MNATIIALIIPFLGTALGSAFVFFMKKDMPYLLQKILLGFASGVMVAASVWSLLIPGMEMGGVWPATIGLLGGFAFLLLIDRITPHLHPVGGPEGPKSKLSKTTMLALAVTIQNVPEGAIISMPLRAAGNSRWRAFGVGALSGVVEPIGGALVILLASAVTPMMPYLLAFAAGAMLYVVVEELVPEASQGEHSNIATVGFALGFALMMILDVLMG
ncbi:MAG: ZIP family metal transporter [Bacteroidales bacterium]|nr:ZIP family metal transporter [Bacteroidales bacterium]